jgi:hypothetical protein
MQRWAVPSVEGRRGGGKMRSRVEAKEGSEGRPISPTWVKSQRRPGMGRLVGWRRSPSIPVDPRRVADEERREKEITGRRAMVSSRVVMRASRRVCPSGVEELLWARASGTPFER